MHEACGFLVYRRDAVENKDRRATSLTFRKSHFTRKSATFQSQLTHKTNTDTTETRFRRVCHTSSCSQSVPSLSLPSPASLFLATAFARAQTEERHVKQ